jgi:hypothetical protein
MQKIERNQKMQETIASKKPLSYGERECSCDAPPIGRG